MLTKWIRERVSVSDGARFACVAELEAEGISRTRCVPLTDEFIELVQRCAIGVCEGRDWPTAAEVRDELQHALRCSEALEGAIVGLRAPSLALFQGAMGALYGSSWATLTQMRLALEMAHENVDQQIVGKTGYIHLLLRSASLRWRQASGVWPALTTDPETGMATTRFLKILRMLLNEAIPEGHEVPKISDYMFRKAIKEARLLYVREDGSVKTMVPLSQ